MLRHKSLLSSTYIPPRQTIRYFIEPEIRYMRQPLKSIGRIKNQTYEQFSRWPTCLNTHTNTRPDAHIFTQPAAHAHNITNFVTPTHNYKSRRTHNITHSAAHAHSICIIKSLQETSAANQTVSKWKFQMQSETRRPYPSRSILSRLKLLVNSLSYDESYVSHFGGTSNF